MAQSRKQKVLQQVQRQRRQRTIISFTIVAVLIAIIVVAIIFLPRPPPNQVPLPDYLSHCVTGATPYHSHPDLVVRINGVGQQIPITFNSGCAQPIHTHTTDGVLHLEPDQDLNYTLGDWFLLWGNFANDRNIAILNSTQIFTYKAGPGTGHQLSMTINGSPDNNPSDFKDRNPANFQMLILPRNAVTGQNNCQTSASIPSCVPYNIVLTYS